MQRWGFFYLDQNWDNVPRLCLTAADFVCYLLPLCTPAKRQVWPWTCLMERGWTLHRASTPYVACTLDRASRPDCSTYERVNKTSDTPFIRKGENHSKRVKFYSKEWKSITLYSHSRTCWPKFNSFKVKMVLFHWKMTGPLCSLH